MDVGTVVASTVVDVVAGFVLARLMLRRFDALERRFDRFEERLDHAFESSERGRSFQS